MIYFVQLENGSIKIGFTGDLEARLTNLASHYGHEPALLATIPGSRVEERAIHERFAAFRFGRTEQFRPAAEIFEFINKPLLIGSNPDVVEVHRPPFFPVKVDAEVVAEAKMVAASRGQTLAEYVSELLRPLVRRDLEAESAKRLKTPSKKPKGGP